jgi:putative methyltransferase
MVDDDGEITAVNSGEELKARLEALSKFQFELLLHAFRFPTARKITYSTCSIHMEENEAVIQKALASAIAKERGWRIMKRDEQIRGMRKWPVRGSLEACGGDSDLADSCIRASKGDEHGTMGFFLAGFIREVKPTKDTEPDFLIGERGHLIRDMMGFPVRPSHSELENSGKVAEQREPEEVLMSEEEEWGGFGDDETRLEVIGISSAAPEKPISKSISKPEKPLVNKHTHGIIKRLQLGVKHDKKRRKGEVFII